jgi:hypothetical protein
MVADGTREVANLTRPLDERAARSSGFNATYRIELPGDRQSLHLVYLAPDRARIDFRGDGLSYTIWVSGGETTLRWESRKGIGVVRVPAEDPDVLWTNCNAALESSFPSRTTGGDPFPDLGPGPRIELLFQSDSDASTDDPITPWLGWTAHRFAFLGWLGATASWNHASIEDEESLNLRRPDATARVSRSTGLVEELTQGTNFVLRMVEFHEGADPNEFVIPDANAMLDDTSSQFIDAVNSFVWRSQRERVHLRLLQAARSSADDPDRFRRRAAPVFRELHRTIVKHHYASTALQWSLDIDQFRQWYEARLRASVPGSEDRDDVEHAAARWRAELELTLANTRETMVARLYPVMFDEESAKLELALLDIERNADRAAFDDEISDPLRQRLDEIVKQIRDAK